MEYMLEKEEMVVPEPMAKMEAPEGMEPEEAEEAEEEPLEVPDLEVLIEIKIQIKPYMLRLELMEVARWVAPAAQVAPVS